MNWDEFKTFFVVLIVVCGGITTIGGAINLLLNWKKQSKTTSHDEMLKNHEERIKDLERDKKEKDGFTKVMCNSILALLSHEINGNSKDKLERVKEELQEFLVNK